jgi:hypothetical protein
MDLAGKNTHRAIKHHLKSLTDRGQLGEEQELYFMSLPGIEDDVGRISVKTSLHTGCPASQGGLYYTSCSVAHKSDYTHVTSYIRTEP